jgi:hypothetical protein
VQQFQFTLNKIALKTKDIAILQCNGELVRGSTATGAATTGSARWPPTFNAHVDQDLSGSPLSSYSSILPFLFTQTPLTLLNFWFPLNDEQVRPLAVRDRRHVEEGDLAKWTEVTFDIASDRFVVTDSSKSGWHYSSDMKPGDLYVFLTGETPHTSFGRPEAGDGIRYSVELRCAALLLPKNSAYIVSTLLVIVLLLFPLLLKTSRRKVKKS